MPRAERHQNGLACWELAIRELRRQVLVEGRARLTTEECAALVWDATVNEPQLEAAE